MALSNLAARVLVAVVAIPLVIGAVYVGDVVLAVTLGVVAALAARELFGIAKAADYAPLSRTGTSIAFLLPIGVHYFRVGRFVPPEIALGAMAIIALFTLALFRRSSEEHPLGAAAVTLLGVLYTAGFLSFGYALRYHNYVVTARAGSALVFYPFVLTWISDTAGYFVGRAFGKSKLMPSVSPGKTRAGAIGALVFCMLASWAYAQWVLVPNASLGLRLGVALTLGAIIGAAVQVGDLVESLLKREGGVKDSSHLIPGHGGVLDRIDGLLFALPVTYFLFTFPHVLLFVNR
ncbi:MAG: phosphatidate cytidylyltransferase [Gemmatimonadaceae bacterium]|nr:phosphatidate cytidylyltransferase [Gemmatimonadaceae bacterium]